MSERAKSLAATFLALIVFPASASVAQATVLTSNNGYPATVNAAQGTTATTKVKIKFRQGTLKCTTFSWTGELTKASEELEVVPNTGGAGTCELGGLAATVSATCAHTLTFPTGETHATCARVTQGTCTIEIPKSTMSGETFANSGTGVAIKLGISGITYTAGAGCPEAGTFSDGTMTGELLATSSKGTIMIE